MDIHKEREAFEAVTNIYHCIYNADLNCYFSGSKFVSDKAEIIVNAGWKAWQAAKAQAVPEGFVLVPKEPTYEMLEAGSEARSRTEGHIASIWEAMIEAQEPTND